MAIRGFTARGRGRCLPARPGPAPSLLGVLLFAPAFLGGCSGHLHLPERVAETQTQVTEVQRRQEALSREIAELRTQLEKQEELLRSARADQNARLSELLESMEVIRNQLEQSSRQSSRVRNRNPQPEAPPDTSGNPGTPTPIGAATPGDSARGPTLDEEGLYQAALQHLQQGRYPLAISGFRQYLSQFPDGPLADEAQYGIGEAYYAQSDFPTAAIEFRALVDTYPNSDKAPAALLKTGLSYYESGKEDVGQAYLERVIEEYPRSEAARKARERLKRRS